MSCYRAQEFTVIKGLRQCLDRPLEVNPSLTLVSFNRAWSWLGPVFSLLVRVKEAWCYTPHMIHIMGKGAAEGRLQHPGEFMLRLSEGSPGNLAFACRPLERFGRRFQHTIVEVTRDGCVSPAARC